MNTRTSRLRTFGVAGIATALAACFHLSPPKVAPSGTFGPRNGREGPRTTGELGIAFAGPRGVIQDHTEAAVTVLFNRPMRALESDESANVPALEVRTKEGRVIGGTLRWVGTRGLLFQPNDTLPGGTSFVATVPSGVRSLDGETLRAPYELAFETPALRVEEAWRSATGTILAPDSKITLRFNQRVDGDAVTKALRLFARGRDSDPGVEIPAKATVQRGTGDGRLVEIAPLKPLPLDSEIQLTLAKGLTGAEGPGAMEASYTWQARTYGPLHLLNFNCPRITASGPCAARNDIRVTLSTPVTPDELARHIVLPRDLRAKPGKDKRAKETKTSTQHYIGADPKPGRKYKITLKAGLRDIFGQKLEKDESFEVSVEAPFVGKTQTKGTRQKPPPQEPSRANGTPGQPDASQGPHRPRLDHRIELGIRGHLLEANATTGHKSHQIPVGTVNLPTYQRLAAPLDEVQTVSFLGTRSFDDFLQNNRLVPSLITSGAQPNVRHVETLDLDALLGGKARGNVLTMVGVPGEGAAQRRLVSVTDLGVTAKASRWGTLVWVTHLSTGKPVADATVSVRTSEKGELWKAKTDAEGVILVPPSAAPLYDEKTNKLLPAVLVVRSGDDWTHLPLERSSTDRRVASSYQEFGARSEWVGIVYTDRGIYRPGEKLKLAGVFRGMDATGLRTVVGKDVRVALSDERGVVIATANAQTDKFGSYSAELPIPRAAHLGEAHLTATVRERGSSAEASTNVRFLAFKASEFKVAVEPGSASLVRGDEASFTVRGEFLFGAPMADAKVRTVLRRSETTFAVPNTPGFSTSDDSAREGSEDEAMRAAELGESADQLDQDGRFVRKARLTLPGQRGPERVTLEADVEDLSRQTVANRASVLVHPAELYVGVKLPNDRFVNAGATLVPAVIAADPSGARRAGVSVHLELVKRSWTTAVEDQPSGVPARTSVRKDEVVGTCDVVTAAEPKGCELRVGEGASYFVRASAKDSRGQTARASVAFYGIESPGAVKPSTAWEARDDGQLKLELNKAVFQPGDTAKVLVQNPFREAEALVTVERNGVLTRKIVPLKGAMPVVEIPVQADYYPNAYISVHAVRGRIQAPPAEGADLGGPEFRSGYAELKLDPEAHRLKVVLATDRKEYRPGEEVDTEVTVTDRAGKPMESAFTFYAVDEGVLMLTSYKTPDPLPPFTRRRPLALFTTENREGLATLLPLRAGERVPILGWEYEVARNGYDKGQDGGGGGTSPPLRADFRTTAFFEAGRTTGPEGKARIKVKLPDNLTTFRLMAVAAGTGDHFGSGEASIITSRKLMARPALPRTLRVGDELSASVLISSKETTGGPAKVTLKATGIGMLGDKTQTTTLVPGKSVEVRFPIKATTPGTATFEFEVEGAGEADRVRVTRNVELPVVMEKVGAYGETTTADALKLASVDKMRSDRGELEVRVAPTALVGVSMGVDDLLQYPYGCTEQLTSRMLPLLALQNAAKEFGLPANAKDRVDEAIPKVLATQRGDGGFGFWDDSAKSSVWLTAYVSLALDAAKKQGHYVPVDARDQATQFLREALRQATAGSSGEDEETTGAAGAGGQGGGPALPPGALTPEETTTIGWAQAAFAGDALATVGNPDPGALTRLFETRKGRPLFARAMLLHAMAVAGLLPTQVEELAKELEAELSISASQAVATDQNMAYLDELLDSQARRTALVLRGLLAANAAHPLAPRLARGLLGLRRDDAWDSTQDTAWSLLALGAYRQAQESQGTNVEARVFLGEDNLLRQGFRGTGDREAIVKVPADRITKAGGESLTFQTVGEGRTYWSAVLTHAPKELPKTPRDDGFFVQKIIRTVAPKDLPTAVEFIPKQTAGAVDAGDLVLVDLLLESSEHQRQVVIDDPLPAGLEALDARIDTTADIRTVADDDGTEATRKPGRGGITKSVPANAMSGLHGAFRAASVHREVHDDRVLTFIEDLPSGLYHFRYLARATSVGRFVVPPTRAEAMYRPDVSGRTAASSLEVRAKK